MLPRRAWTAPRQPRWQPSLNDYSVTYQLNCYTNRTDIMPRLYSDLHRNILDQFNAAGVEIMSPYGIRALSRWHLEHPFSINVHGDDLTVQYLPGESNTGMFGGNSNWRGPIWMPVNALLVRALLQYYEYYGDDFKVECPTGSGTMMTLYEVAREITDRLAAIFLRNDAGQRPVYGGTAKFQDDPHWRDLILFYEYFHGDNGAGLGASHQTGWTGVVARLMQFFAAISPDMLLAQGKSALATLSEG